MKKLYSYLNGDVHVTIYSDGTKIREFSKLPYAILHPESIDCKITNWCDAGCKFCHEMSTTSGKHADLKKLKEILKELPAGVELAIGGGNPLAHPDLLDFLQWGKDKGLIINMTVNQLHLKEYLDDLKYYLVSDFIKGLGISIMNNHYNEIKELKTISNNIVYHLIAGIHNPEKIDELIKLGNCKVLILGYKQIGRGKNYYSDKVSKSISDWENKIQSYFNKCITSFDNLAIKQLKIKDKIDKNIWETSYMGDDFTHTMYIDAVRQEYGPTSTSSYSDRVSFEDDTLFNYFVTNRING